MKCFTFQANAISSFDKNNVALLKANKILAKTYASV